MNKRQIIISRLQDAFSPTYLEVIDESSQHAGHAGFDESGSHFAIIVTSSSLEKLSRVAAHRKIYELFTDMIPDQIHALRIQIKN